VKHIGYSSKRIEEKVTERYNE